MEYAENVLVLSSCPGLGRSVGPLSAKLCDGGNTGRQLGYVYTLCQAA